VGTNGSTPSLGQSGLACGLKRRLAGSPDLRLTTLLLTVPVARLVVTCTRRKLHLEFLSVALSESLASCLFGIRRAEHTPCRI